MRIQLRCGHIIVNDVLLDYYICDDCKLAVMPFAFECREWKARCQVTNCRYSRFYGANRTTASRAAAKHEWQYDHTVLVNFIFVDKKKEAVKTFYGRKVKTIILNERTEEFVMSRAYRVKFTRPLDEECSDEPPF